MRAADPSAPAALLKIAQLRSPEVISLLRKIAQVCARWRPGIGFAPPARMSIAGMHLADV
jgi:hypothetical protein